MLLADLTFIARYGSALPFADDCEEIPVLAGEKPASISWLWSQVGEGTESERGAPTEHRLPLPKLVWLALAKLSDFDFRSG
jgi:hypothetical protein